MEMETSKGQDAKDAVLAVALFSLDERKTGDEEGSGFSKGGSGGLCVGR